jgi:5-methylcytosine-specific restriction endonuclease McrA
VYCFAEAFGYAHRSRHRSPISGSVKYRVLTRARGRCECCGADEHQRALGVDHIMPRNQGGSVDISNLQALCFRCNAGNVQRETAPRALSLSTLQEMGRRERSHACTEIPCGRRRSRMGWLGCSQGTL